MKRDLWAGVKRGSYVIYASEYVGVFRVLVVEVDIKIYEPGPPARWAYPYGMTAETGTVKIKFDETEMIHNLSELIAFSTAGFDKLRLAWLKWQEKKAEAEELKVEFLAEIQEMLE